MKLIIIRLNIMGTPSKAKPRPLGCHLMVGFSCSYFSLYLRQDWNGSYGFTSGIFIYVLKNLYFRCLWIYSIDRQHFSLEVLSFLINFISFVKSLELLSADRQGRQETSRWTERHRGRKTAWIACVWSDRHPDSNADASDGINWSLQQTRELDLCRLTRARLMG